MVRLSSFLLLIGVAPAQAHTGHLGELAGHDHVVLGAALGAAILAGIIGALKGEDSNDDENDAEVTPELQEA